MLHAIEINSSNADNKELKQLYETAFPAEEQIPYDELIQLLDAMNIDYTAYHEGEVLVGFTMVRCSMSPPTTWTSSLSSGWKPS